MDEILNLIESVSEGFPSYSLTNENLLFANAFNFFQRMYQKLIICMPY